MSMDSIRKKTISGFLWMFAEKVGAQVISFVVSIVLARILMPEEYGIMSIVFVIINLCDVLVENGFCKALIQNKDTDEQDYSSAFWGGLVISLLLYVSLFFAAPAIGRFYRMELLSPIIRVMGLRGVLAAYGSVLKARVSREMAFRKFFLSSLGGTLLSAVVGIAMAYMGFGVWALVAQNMVDAVVDTLVLAVTIRWYPKFVFSLRRVKRLLDYGWKVLVGSLVDTLYDNFRSLHIGRIYTADDLAFYTRGRQFPNFLTENISFSISSVLFPAVASQREDKSEAKALTRRTMKTSAYVVTPVLCGLAAVAEPLVALVLTEKWLPCVPYLQILCIYYALDPLHVVNIQVTYACGRSDICLKLNVVKRIFGVLLIMISSRISVEAVAWAEAIFGLFSLLISALPNRKLIGYHLLEQLRDVIPCWILSGGMVICVRMAGMLTLPVFSQLVLMVLTGIVSYILLSLVFRMESFFYLLKLLGSFLKKRNEKQ